MCIFNVRSNLKLNFTVHLNSNLSARTVSLVRKGLDLITSPQLNNTFVTNLVALCRAYNNVSTYYVRIYTIMRIIGCYAYFMGAP